MSVYPCLTQDGDVDVNTETYEHGNQDRGSSLQHRRSVMAGVCAGGLGPASCIPQLLGGTVCGGALVHAVRSTHISSYFIPVYHLFFSVRRLISLTISTVLLPSSRRYLRKGVPNRRREMLRKPRLGLLCHHTFILARYLLRVFYNLSSLESTPFLWS